MTATSSRITDFIGVGLAAARPATPNLATGSFGLYYATDTSTLSVWTGAAWSTLSGSGTLTSLLAAAGTTGGTITTTGTVTAANAPPQGRLTLVSATPVMVSDQTAKTNVYYTPFVGNSCPVYDGTYTRPMVFTELTMALDSSNQILENIYDLFVWNNSGTPAIGAGPAWVNTATVTWTSASPGVCSWTGHGLSEGSPVIFTAGTSTPTGITAGTPYYVSKTGLGANSFSVSTSIANAAAGTNVNTSSTGTGTQTGTNHTTLRGTGAGTTELELKNGVWTNKNSITLKNGAGGGTAGIGANTATYVGSIYCTANGQTGMAFRPSAASGGSNAILGVWNAYNRVKVESASRDNTASWSYTTATWRAANGNVLNRVNWIDGLAQSEARATYSVCGNGTTGSTAAATGVSMNSTTTNPTYSAVCSSTPSSTMVADESFSPTLGLNYAQAQEYSTGATATFNGVATGALQNQQLLLRLDM